MEMEAIMDKVEVLLLENRSQPWIARHLKMPLRTVADYAERAKKRWEERYAGDRETLRAQRLARINQLSSKAERARSWSAVSSLERLIADVHGLRTMRHELTGKDGTPLAMSPEQAAEEMRKVVEEIANRRKAETPTPAPTPAVEGDGSEEDES